MAPLLVLTHNGEHVYAVVPNDLETLEQVARKEFNFGDVDVDVLSPCASLCHGRPARITKDTWEHIRPYIRCATVRIARRDEYASAKRKLSTDEPTSATEDEEQLRSQRRRVETPEIKQEKASGPPNSTPSPIKQENRPSGQSTHTDSDTQADKLMIRVAHRPSNQESKFMTKSSTSVGKVLAGACRSFNLDVNLATLYLIVTVEEEGGNAENLFPCDSKDTISRAGAERDKESRFLLKMAGEA